MDSLLEDVLDEPLERIGFGPFFRETLRLGLFIPVVVDGFVGAWAAVFFARF
ncbi:MAG: hypothetical protein VX278_11205 [Myxococcota bacterium]|nr:hypothetical protein [Myxococcota bacterium]